MKLLTCPHLVTMSCLITKDHRWSSYIIRVGPCFLCFAAVRVDNIQVLIAQKTATAQYESIEATEMTS